MSVQAVNKTYITSGGLFHFQNMTEGERAGDFYNLDEIYEVSLVKSSSDYFIPQKVIESIPEEFSSEEDPCECDGEYHITYGGALYTGKIIKYLGTNPVVIGVPSLTFIGDSSSISFNISESSQGSSNISFPKGANLKGYIRIKGILVISSNKYNTLVTKERKVYTGSIEELYREI